MTPPKSICHHILIRELTRSHRFRTVLESLKVKGSLVAIHTKIQLSNLRMEHRLAKDLGQGLVSKVLQILVLLHKQSLILLALS